MTLWMPKKKPLYAPMLATFGGGSVRGFQGGGGPGELTSLSLNARVDNPDNSTASVTLPSGINAGDLLIIQEYGPDVSSSVTGNIPSGFSLITYAEHAAVDHRVHYKVATGNESQTTVTGQTGSNEDMTVFVFRGDAPISSASVSTSGSTSNTDYPSVSITPSTSDPTIVFFGAGSRSSNNVSFQSQSPSGIWTTYTDINGNNNNEAEAFAWLFSASGVNSTYSMQMTTGNSSRDTILAAALTLSV